MKRRALVESLVWVQSRGHPRRLAGVGLGMLLLAATGCGNRASYSGTVTYDGKELDEGQVSFIALSDSGTPPASTAIQKGKYSISGLKPGKIRVHVSAVKEISTPTAGIDPDLPLAEPTPVTQDLIPPNALGNDQTIDVTPGSHTLDLKLEKPARK